MAVKRRFRDQFHFLILPRPRFSTTYPAWYLLLEGGDHDMSPDVIRAPIRCQAAIGYNDQPISTAPSPSPIAPATSYLANGTIRPLKHI